MTSTTRSHPSGVVPDDNSHQWVVSTRWPSTSVAADPIVPILVLPSLKLERVCFWLLRLWLVVLTFLSRVCSALFRLCLAALILLSRVRFCLFRL